MVVCCMLCMRRTKHNVSHNFHIKAYTYIPYSIHPSIHPNNISSQWLCGVATCIEECVCLYRSVCVALSLSHSLCFNVQHVKYTVLRVHIRGIAKRKARRDAQLSSSLYTFHDVVHRVCVNYSHIHMYICIRVTRACFLLCVLRVRLHVCGGTGVAVDVVAQRLCVRLRLFCVHCGWKDFARDVCLCVCILQGNNRSRVCLCVCGLFRAIVESATVLFRLAQLPRTEVKCVFFFFAVAFLRICRFGKISRRIREWSNPATTHLIAYRIAASVPSCLLVKVVLSFFV